MQGLSARLPSLTIVSASAVQSVPTAGSRAGIPHSVLPRSTAAGGSWHSLQTQPPACTSGHSRRVSCASECSHWSPCSEASAWATISPSRGLLQRLHVSDSRDPAVLHGAFHPSQPSLRHGSTAAVTARQGRALDAAQQQATSAAAVSCGTAALPYHVQWRGYAVSTKGHQPSTALREIGNQQLRSFVESPGMLAEPYTCGDVLSEASPQCSLPVSSY